ncbi:MAG: hypothetical protein A2381_09460 [Bdellovibrionales bacterium RIFOXYB1_FULL_37_110]|nr:MAG: hypothetical protein A2417_03035 [Bdellovibrionales bacterium RIFOXYC1_FULL_37_79]OFZ59490.1 MAG: hypothetical protein A2381_09460 [Bdellovibrionales bacterium RIFOXYB1_FULL_37_110]OFZ64209.1 MAG: hypothetical protein A2577_12310 [Bdellovibrionales bacterium RIFOXYD1_FULL_36_51]
MKFIFGLLFLIIVIGTVHAGDPTVKHKDLLEKQELIFVTNIEVNGIVDGTEAATFNPTAIKLHINGDSGCGKKFLVDFQNDVISFFQIDTIGLHKQPLCKETIEYYWTPSDYSLADGETKIITQKIGPVRSLPYDSPQQESYFEVSAKVTTKIGYFPNGNGMGYYFTYSDIRVEGPK